jgi:imidazolonepropionase-like amidohydrolase
MSPSSGSDNPGCCGGHQASIGWVVDGVPSVLTAVRTNLKDGADFIKIMGGGGVASPSDGIETVQFSPEEIRAITETAWRMGKKMVSASYQRSCSRCF